MNTENSRIVEIYHKVSSIFLLIELNIPNLTEVFLISLIGNSLCVLVEAL